MDQEQYQKLDPTTQEWLPVPPPSSGMSDVLVAAIVGACSLIALLLGTLLGVGIAPAVKTHAATTSPTITTPAIGLSTTSTEAVTTTEPAATSTTIGNG